MSNAQTFPQNPQLTPQISRIKNLSGADIIQVERPGEGIVARWNEFQSPVYSGVGAPTATAPASPCKDALYLDTAAGTMYLFDGTAWNLVGEAGATPDWVNIKTFGADPTGTTDSTAAIQAALNAAVNQVVYVPAGTYLISAGLTCGMGVSGIVGDGPFASKIVANNSSFNAVLFTNTDTKVGFFIRNIGFTGAGQSAANANNGIYLTHSSISVVEFPMFENVNVNSVPGIGFVVDKPITANFIGCRSSNNVYGFQTNGSTSCAFTACYALTNLKAGYSLNGTHYSTFNACAADHNGCSYYVWNSASVITFNGCGSEQTVANNKTITQSSSVGGVATVQCVNDFSSDLTTGTTIVINDSTANGGALNGRWVVTTATGTSVSFTTGGSDFSSVSDSGTASIFPGDTLVVRQSTSVTANGIYLDNPGQVYSSMVVLDGVTREIVLNNLNSTGTNPQTNDLWFGGSVSQVMRWNNALTGGVHSLATSVQTYSTGSSLWTLSPIASSTGTPASTGQLRLPSNSTAGGSVAWRNAANSADLPLQTNGSDQLTFNSKLVAQALASLFSAPTGDVLTADGSGNVQDSGTLLSSLAPKASPALTGAPTAPTQAAFDNSTKIATDAYADNNFKGVSVAGFRDDFLYGDVGASIGTVGTFKGDTIWTTLQIVAAATISASTNAATFANPGNATITTGTSSGNGAVVYKTGGTSSTATLGALGSNAGWEMNFVFNLPSSGNIAIRVGTCIAGQNAGDAPTAGMYCEYDTANTGNSNTGYTLVTRNASTSSYAGNTTAPNTSGYDHIRIFSTVAGTISMQVNGGTIVTSSTNVSTAAQGIFLQLLTRTGSGKVMILDFVSYMAATGRS